MTSEILHPDKLEPGSTVGPWRIVEILGTGGFGRVFQVERDGQLFALKMALRPASEGPLADEEEDAEPRLKREVAALLACEPHPLLPRVHMVDRWPGPGGFFYFVTDSVEGDDFHEWCRKTKPSAARLLDRYTEVVRGLGELHRRGLSHRDLKAAHILIRREDERPFLIDFGSVYLPGATPLTAGLPPGTLHLQPPEVIAFAREEQWKHGARFEGGEAVDRYALGVLLYEALTGHHPFNPRMPTEELLVAIETVEPRAPHHMNPNVPRPLSDISLRLLAKRPEDRYASTEALLQALWEAAKERTAPAWKVPLVQPESEPAEVTPEELMERLERKRAAERRAKEARPAEKKGGGSAPGEKRTEAPAESPRGGESPPRSRWDWLRGRRLAPLAAVVGVGVLFLAMGLARATLGPSTRAEPIDSASRTEGDATMPTSDPNASSPTRREPRHAGAGPLVVAWLCATTSLGCAPAQVLPPAPSQCPNETMQSMNVNLGINASSLLNVLVDINQPGDFGEMGVFRDGPVTGQVTLGDGNFPVGSLLFGEIWTGPGIYDDVSRKVEAVMVRYTMAQRVGDNRRYPVCIVAGSKDGRVRKEQGSQPGAAVLSRQQPATIVWDWP